MNKKLMLVIIPLLLFISMSWYFYYQSPYYAIQELDQALQNKNLAKVYRRIDLLNLVASARSADDVNKAAGSPKEEQDLLSGVRSQFQQGLAKLSDTLNEEAVQHEFESELLRDRKIPKPLPEKWKGSLSFALFFEVEKVEFKDWTYNENGALANVILSLSKLKATIPLTLRLTKSDGGLWRVAGFVGLSSALAKYDSMRKEYLQTYNRNFEAKVNNRLSFYSEIYRKQTAFGEEIGLDCVFYNKGPERMTHLSGDIYSSRQENQILVKLVDQAVDINAGERKALLLSESQLLNTSIQESQKERFFLRVNKLVYANGEKLARVYDYDDIY